MLKIQKIIIKFLGKEASESEMETLESWLQDNKNTPLFNQFVRINYLTALCMKKYDLDKAKSSINNKLKDNRKKRNAIYFQRIAIAASLLLLISFSILKFTEYDSDEKNTIVDKVQTIESGTDKAILTLENGAEVALEKGSEYKNEKLRSNGEELVYNVNNERKSQSIEYNYLTIPRGGQFSIKLSDGTKVWVNSESKLKYPTSFIPGKSREVELIYGEAYFEVSPSEKHNGATFNVITREQNVTVLGTEFNVRAYKSDKDIITTLSGGQVTVEQHGVKKFLQPDQQSIIRNNSSQIAIQNIDASNVTAWVKGLFIFEDKNLDEMMDDLSRWYDVEVFFESQKLKEIPFTGILERTKSLNELLTIIEESGEGEVSFDIKEKLLIIK